VKAAFLAGTKETNLTEEKAMSATIDFPNAAQLLRPVEKESSFAVAKLKKVKPISKREERLWKLSAQVVSPRFARIELFALILFLTIAVVGVVSCFAELSQLLDNDAIGWIAQRVIGRA
jgi:hypothetical protein